MGIFGFTELGYLPFGHEKVMNLIVFIRGGSCQNNIISVYHKDDHSSGRVATVNAPFALKAFESPFGDYLVESLFPNIAHLSHTVDTFINRITHSSLPRASKP